MVKRILGVLLATVALSVILVLLPLVAIPVGFLLLFGIVVSTLIYIIKSEEV